jgi:hypothetical protein
MSAAHSKEALGLQFREFSPKALATGATNAVDLGRQEEAA